MVSGAANADAAFLLVDATLGIREQTKRHAFILKFLGISQIIVLVNKMDLIEFSKSIFDKLSTEIKDYLNELDIQPFNIIPISARHGDQLTTASQNIPWYHGLTVIETVNQLSNKTNTLLRPLRFPVQDIYKFDERRILAGRIESGKISVGDILLFSPSGQTAEVKSIEQWNSEKLNEAYQGQSIGITLDKPIFIERGELISHANTDLKPCLTSVFRATLFWLGQSLLEQGKIFKLKLLTRETSVTVQSIEHEIDIESLTKQNATYLKQNCCAEVILRTQESIPLDEYSSFPRTGRFVLVDGYEIVAGGMISMKGFPDQRSLIADMSSNLTSVIHHVNQNERLHKYGHKSGVLWFTGLSGAGKSTLAMRVEQILFKLGFLVYTLDGDNIRKGLNANLSFSPIDRMENIRRIGEVAALFADAGFLCITAFISPYQDDREKVSKMVPKQSFHEIYIKADLKTCEHRDPKGLYKKARLGEITEFTGVSAPYEPPLDPQLIIDTTQLSIEESVNTIIDYVVKHFALDFSKGLKMNKPETINKNVEKPIFTVEQTLSRKHFNTENHWKDCQTIHSSLVTLVKTNKIFEDFASYMPFMLKKTLPDKKYWMDALIRVIRGKIKVGLWIHGIFYNEQIIELTKDPVHVYIPLEKVDFGYVYIRNASNDGNVGEVEILHVSILSHSQHKAKAGKTFYRIKGLIAKLRTKFRTVKVSKKAPA